MTNFEQPKSPLLKIREAANYIGMSISWLKQHGSRIKYVRIGRSKRWKLADLDEFIAKNTRGECAK